MIKHDLGISVRLNQELLNSIFKHKEVKYDKTFNNSDR